MVLICHKKKTVGCNRCVIGYRCRLVKFGLMELNSGPSVESVMIYVGAPPLHQHSLRHLPCLSHTTMRIHFSLIAGISGNKGNERAASYGLIHQELIEASLVSSADRAGVVLERAGLYVCSKVCVTLTFATKWLWVLCV